MLNNGAIVSKNSLYNLVLATFEPHTFKHAGALKLSALTHSSGSPYFLFELPLENPVIIDDLTLVSHHISVFEQSSSKLDLKSQYHYTAYFESGVGEIYRLHVFLNEKDKPVNKPLLAIKTGENTFEAVESPEYDEAFSMLAAISTKTLIDNLRTTQHSALKKYNDTFQDMEVRASELSKNLGRNHEEYKTLIIGMIAQLDAAQQITNDKLKLAGTISFLKNIKKTLDQSEAIKPKPTDRAPATASSTSSSSSATVQSKPKTVAKPKRDIIKKAQPAKTHDEHDEAEQPTFVDLKLEALDTKFLKCKTRADAKTIEALHNELISLEISLPHRKKLASVESILHLHELKNNVETLGKNSLIRCLIAEEFNAADQLASFYPLIVSTIIPIALSSNKPQILEFLFTKQLLSPEFTNFTIGKTTYASMVDFCFKTYSPNKNTLALLSCLVANGCSLLEIDKESGLPFAALLMEGQHPLREVLVQQGDKTVNTPIFYKKLSKQLNMLCGQLDCSPAKAERIKALTDAIILKANDSNLVRKVGGKHSVQLNTEYEAQRLDTLGADLTMQINQDAELQAILRHTSQQVSALLDELPPNEKVLAKQNLRVTYENLSKNLTTLKGLDLQQAFTEIKSECIRQQNIILQIVDLKRQHMAIKRTIRDPNLLFNNGQVRTYNKANSQLTRIAQEIAPLQEELNALLAPVETTLETILLPTGLDITEVIMNAFNGGSANAPALNRILKEILRDATVAPKTVATHDDDGIPDLTGVDFLAVSQETQLSLTFFASPTASTTESTETSEPKGP